MTQEDDSLTPFKKHLKQFWRLDEQSIPQDINIEAEAEKRYPKQLHSAPSKENDPKPVQETSTMFSKLEWEIKRLREINGLLNENRLQLENLVGLS